MKKDILHSPAWGLVCLAITALLFAIMAIIVKMVVAFVPGPEVALIRFSVGLLASGAVHFLRPLRPKNWRGLFLRGLYGGCSVGCYYMALTYLPAGLATLLLYTSPVFTAVYAIVFMKEKLTGITLSLLAVSTFGVVIVMASTAPANSTFSVWQVVALVGAMISGISVANISDLRNKGERPWEIFAAYCAGGVIINLLLLALGQWKWTSLNPRGWGLVLVAACISVVSQLLLGYAYGFLQGRTASSSAMFQLTPIATMGLDRLIFGSVFGRLALVGAAMTIYGVVADALVTVFTKKRSIKSKSA